MIFQLGGMLLLKAPGYRMVEGNSQYVNSYAYSLEKGAQSRKSFYYPMCKLGSSHNPTYYNVGKLKNFERTHSVFHSKLVGTPSFQQSLIDLYCDRRKRLLSPQSCLSSPYNDSTVLHHTSSFKLLLLLELEERLAQTHTHPLTLTLSPFFHHLSSCVGHSHTLNSRASQKEIFSLSSQSLFMLSEGV